MVATMPFRKSGWGNFCVQLMKLFRMRWMLDGLSRRLLNPLRIRQLLRQLTLTVNLLSFVIILLWEVIYAHFYNWDKPLDLVPIVCDLIELIIETSLWSKDYSTFDIHPQHTRLCLNNAYFICVIVHVQMWCVCSSTCWSNPKRFLSVLYVFESDFLLSCL